MSGRWWWQGEVYPETKRLPRRSYLYSVDECGSNPPRPPGQLSGGIGVVELSRWIDHLEGLPPR